MVQTNLDARTYARTHIHRSATKNAGTNAIPCPIKVESNRNIVGKIYFCVSKRFQFGRIQNFIIW